MIIIHTRTKVGRVIGRIVSRFRSRQLEWEHAIITLLFGVILLVNPAVFSGPSFAAFPGGAILWGCLLIAAGAMRIMALCINGYMARPTATLRAISTVIGIAIFAALSLGFLFSWRWPTALAVYPVLGFFGLFSLSWTIFDIAIPDRHDDEPK